MKKRVKKRNFLVIIPILIIILFLEIFLIYVLANWSIEESSGLFARKPKIRYECNDRADNDGDGFCDFGGCYMGRGKNRVWLPADPDCLSKVDTTELGSSMLPDTAEILFVSNRHDPVNRRAEIYSMDANGANQERLTFSNYHHFIMGIDHSRRYIVTSRAEIDTNSPEGLGDEDDRAVWIIDLYTGQETRLTDINNHAEGKSFSPDSEWIVFAMRTPGENLHDIYKIKRDGTSLTRLTNNPKYMEVDVAWSNTGDKIAFDFADFQEEDPHSVIKIMDSNGENIKSLHDERAGVPIPNAFVAGDYDPSWSSNDEWIAFERPVAYNDSNPENFGSGIAHIFKIKSDGSGEIIDLSLIGGHADRAEYLPSFSPDGKWIAFGSIHRAEVLEESFSDIFKMDSETGISTRLTTSPGVDMYPVWIK